MLGCLLLILLGIRLIRLRDRLTVYLVLGIGVLYTGLAWVNNPDHQPKVTQTVDEVVSVYPDKINVNGGSFNFVARSSTAKQNVVYYAQFKSDQQKHQLLSADHELEFHLQGDVAPIKPPTNVNQFDMKAYEHHQGIVEACSVKNLVSMAPKLTLSPIGWVHWLRIHFNQYCQKLPHMLQIYAMGLISGTRENDFFEQMTGVKQLGLLHLFSISGMHVYYFLAIIDNVLTIIGVGKSGRRIIQLICLAGYFIFSGSSPGLLRAVIMATVSIGGRLLHFNLSQLAAFSITVIIHLMLAPEALFMMSVQLSYGLAFGLIATNGKSFLRQTFLLNLLSLPILLFHVYEWHVLSLVINLLVLPLFGRIIFPLVIGGVILGTVNITLTAPIALGLSWFNAFLNFTGQLPGMIVFGKPAFIVVIAMLALTVGLLVIPGKKLRLIKAGLVIVYAGAFIWIHFPLTGEVTMFDVGQGDSFLIRQPFNQTITMIDTGGKVTFGQQKWQRGVKTYQASRVSINYLKSIGISRIDNICISHQDSDHCGDLPAVLKELRVKRLLIPLGMESNPNFMKRIAQRQSITRLVPVCDRSIVLGLPMQIMHPFVPGKGENHDSMVLSGRFGGLNWLFTGDLDQQGELDTLGRHPGLTTDVIKVGHHGSRTASGPHFINQIHPKIALISAGRHNRYHHPNVETLQTLMAAHIKIYNTQEMGMVRYVYGNHGGHFETMLRK